MLHLPGIPRPGRRPVLGGGAWTPQDEASFVAWFQYGQGLTGDPTVTAWADQGETYDLTATGDPQRDAGGEITFDGSDHLGGDAIATGEYQATLGSAPGLTWGVVVGKPASTGNEQVLAMGRNDSNFNSRLLLYFNTASRVLFDVRDNAGNNASATSSGTYAAETLRIVATMTAAGAMVLRVNGVEVATATASVAAAYLSQTFTVAALNRNGSVVQNLSNGTLREIILFNDALTGESLTNLETRLATVAAL